MHNLMLMLSNLTPYTVFTAIFITFILNVLIKDRNLKVKSLMKDSEVEGSEPIDRVSNIEIVELNKTKGVEMVSRLLVLLSGVLALASIVASSLVY